MQARELKNPVDRAYAVRAEKAISIRSISHTLRTQPLINWCPACMEYRADNHPQPCNAQALAMAAD